MVKTKLTLSRLENLLLTGKVPVTIDPEETTHDS